MSIREPVAVRSRIGTGWEAPALLIIMIALLSIGLIQVYSASSVMALNEGERDYYYVVRQVTGAAVGFVLLAVAARMDYRRLRFLAWPLMLGVIAALLAMVIGPDSIAPERNGANRWLTIGPVALQP